ncbi:hypothetical protein V1520DRAFT_281939 [Lipomyces starkeyi]|uniref:Secreted protein n=1 Tax=Lipomyces starkeyi NRRL Y-11557 TaxID=675824 RepID=A0A1E3Q6R2_LIPST|nr:hypothetical protein LIPSTDRAFT_291116 [Lipomyces starkeyi NRRL Y-11557]
MASQLCRALTLFSLYYFLTGHCNHSCMSLQNLKSIYGTSFKRIRCAFTSPSPPRTCPGVIHRESSNSSGSVIKNERKQELEYSSDYASLSTVYY